MLAYYQPQYLPNSGLDTHSHYNSVQRLFIYLIIHLWLS